MRICGITAKLECRKICLSSKICKVIAKDSQQVRNMRDETQHNPPKRSGEIPDGTRMILHSKQERCLAKREQALIPKIRCTMSRACEIIPFSSGEGTRSINHQQCEKKDEEEG